MTRKSATPASHQKVISVPRFHLQQADGPPLLPPAVGHCGRWLLLALNQRRRMSGKKKHCLDDPSKPHKAFRDILGKRRKTDADALKEKLTPALRQALAEFKSEGRELGAERASSILKELGNALEAALDGDLELDGISCEYCAASQRHKERHAAAVAAAAQSGQVDACRALRFALARLSALCRPD